MATVRMAIVRASIVPLVWTLISVALTMFVLDSSPHVGLISFDAGNFILAAQDFRISADQPHMPGYPGIVAIAKLVDPLLGPASGLRLLGLLVPLSAFLLGLGLSDRLGWKGAMATQALVLTSPFVWFFAFTAETYAIDLLVGTCLTLIILRDRGHRWLPALLGITAFFRPVTAVLLLPGILWLLWSVRRSLSVSSMITPLIIAVSFFLSALYGILIGSDGIDGLITLIRSGPPVPMRPFSELFPFAVYTAWFCVPLLPVMWRSGKRSSVVVKPLIITFLSALMFFAIGHYAKGYLMLIVPAMIVGVVSMRRISWQMITVSVFVQAVMFLLLPSMPDPLPKNSPQRSSNAVVRMWERTTSSYSCTLDRINDLRRFWDSAMPWIGRQHGPILFKNDVAPTVRIAQALSEVGGKNNRPWWGHTKTDDQNWVRLDRNGLHEEGRTDTALAASTLFTLDSLPK